MQQNHETTVQPDTIHRVESQTVNILLVTASLVVSMLSLYLMFFDGSAAL